MHKRTVAVALAAMFIGGGSSAAAADPDPPTQVSEIAAATKQVVPPYGADREQIADDRAMQVAQWYTAAANLEQWYAVAAWNDAVAANEAAAAASQPRMTRTTRTSNAPTRTSGDGSWDRIAQCESGGNWSINTGNGYYGGLQFSLGSWQSVGGTGLPSDASRETQILMGQRLQARSGWGSWPACSRRLGLL